MCDLTYVRLTGLWLGSVPCVPGVSVSLLPSDTSVVWFIPLRRENGKKTEISWFYICFSSLCEPTLH